MVRNALNHLLVSVFFLLSGLLLGCQTSLTKVGKEHAREVEKWQTLANYAGNELKPLGLTITAAVQINNQVGKANFSLNNVQLNRAADHTEIDLLSPEFAEKFACTNQCVNLGQYNSDDQQAKTQLARFFYAQEGRFFEFYGKLTEINTIIANYRSAAPDILESYFTLLLQRNARFDSLTEFISYLQQHVNEQSLIAYSKNGFTSPEPDRLSPTFANDLLATFPAQQIIVEPLNQDLIAIDNLRQPNENWVTNDADFTSPIENISPDENWLQTEQNLTESDVELVLPSDMWDLSTHSVDDALFDTLISDTQVSQTIATNWQLAKQQPLQIGSVVCSYSDNSFGVVKVLSKQKATLALIAKARIIVDGVNLNPQPGYLFAKSQTLSFIKNTNEQNFARTDIAYCDIAELINA